jgi:hypothetical protein
MSTQLLCTFCKTSELEATIKSIGEKYQVVPNKIFVLENEDDPYQIILTYNVQSVDMRDVLDSTISVHRKKQTNTIYTINALNFVIMEKNDGILDKRFVIDWNEFENVILVTANRKLKKINTQIREVVEI